jgi:transmembrane sensor
MKLPDGSLVELNTDSAVEVRFSPAQRRVRLTRGEAHFTVAKNPQIPFTVDAGGVSIRAVGTAFDVRLSPEKIDVLVTEGKVRVDSKNLIVHLDSEATNPLTPPAENGFRPMVVIAGERVSVDQTSPTRATVASIFVPEDDIQHALAWQRQRLEFVATPLSDIVAEFNRYDRHKLVIADPSLAAQRFGGTFKSGDSAGFVRVLKTHFNVVAEEHEGETILKSAP